MRSSLTSTLSEVKLRKRRRHQPHQAVEDDFQHRQAFIGHQRRIDDRADAGFVVERDVAEAEPKQTVDFVLVEDALGAAFAGLQIGRIVVEHRRPLRGGFIDALARSRLPSFCAGAPQLPIPSARPHSAASAF